MPKMVGRYAARGIAMTCDEQKQRIMEKLRDAAATFPPLDEDGLRVAVYRRTSPELFNQITFYQLMIRQYQEYFRKRNWKLKAIYSDEGWDDYTALDKLVDDCANGEIDLVVIRSANHVSHDMNKVLEIARAFEDRSVDVLFEAENILGSSLS